MSGFLQLPLPIPTHDLVSIVLHLTVDSMGVVANTTLLLAIFFRTPPTLRSYAVILVNSVLMDLIASLCALFAMVRPIPAGDMASYVYDGPCVQISGFFCHCLYTVVLATFGQTLFLIAMSFAFRLHTLTGKNPSPSKVSLGCLLISAPNIVVLTTFMFTLDDSDSVRKALAVARPEYALDDYVVEGHLSIYSPLVMFTVVACIVPNGPIMAVIFVLRKKVLSRIREKSVEMSRRTLKMHKSFTKVCDCSKMCFSIDDLVHVLSLQSMLPATFSVAIVAYVLCQTNTLYSPALEHLISEAASIFPLMAPLITLYYVQVYRSFVEENLLCRKPRKVSSVDSITDYSPRKVSVI